MSDYNVSPVGLKSAEFRPDDAPVVAENDALVTGWTVNQAVQRARLAIGELPVVLLQAREGPDRAGPVAPGEQAAGDPQLSFPIVWLEPPGRLKPAQRVVDFSP